jgi:hypothetical protein
VGGSEVSYLVYACFEVRHEGVGSEGPQGVLPLGWDAYFSIVFHDMHRLLRRKDLDIAQVTLFAM